MARWNGRFRRQGASTWGALFTGYVDDSPAEYPWTVAGLDAPMYEVQVQEVDPVDGEVSDWSDTLLVPVAHATTAAGPMVVAELEYQVGSGPRLPVLDPSIRLAATQYPWEVAGLPAGTVRVWVRERDLSDDSPAGEWSDPLTIPIEHPAPAAQTAIATLPPLRGIPAAERAVMVGREAVIWHRLLADDPDGVPRPLTALQGEDFLVGIEWELDPDAPVVNATISLHREIRRANGTILSLAPLVEGSPLNTRANGTYAPFLREGAGLYFETATLELGEDPTAGDWLRVWQGTQGDADVGGPIIRLPGLGLGTALQKKIITVARPYGADEGVPLPTVARQKLGDNGFGGLTLAVAPGLDYALRKQEQAAGVNVFDALLADLMPIGWLARYRWTGRQVAQLAIYPPPREALSDVTVPALTLGPDEYVDVTEFTIDTTSVKNVLLGSYIDPATGKREYAEVRDEDSIAQYGERAMQLAYEAGNNINSRAALLRMLGNARDDLSMPYATVCIDVPYYGAVELGDVIRLLPNDTHHDTPQTLAVVRAAHRFAREGEKVVRRTRLWLRGRPMGVFRQWFKRQAVAVIAVPLELKAYAEQVGATDDTITYRLTGDVRRAGVPTGQVPTAQVRTLRNGAMLAPAGGPLPGVPAPSGTLWTFQRPPEGGAANFVARVEYPGAAADELPVWIPPQGVVLEGLARLVVLEMQTLPHPLADSVTHTRIVFGAAGGTATGDATITATRSGALDLVTALGGGAPVVTGPLPLVAIFETPRQAHFAGESMLEMVGSAPGLLSAGDHVTIHPVGQDTITPRFNLRRKTTWPDRVEIWAEYFDRLGAPITPDALVILEGAELLHPSYPGGVGTEALPWVVARAPHGSGGRRFGVRADRAGYLSVQDSENIEPVERDTVTLECIVEAVQETSHRLFVRIVGRDPVLEITPDIVLTGHETTAGVTLLTEAVPMVGMREQTYHVFLPVSAQPGGAPQGRIDVTVGAAGRVSDYGGVDVPPYRLSGPVSMAISYMAVPDNMTFPDNKHVGIMWLGSTYNTGGTLPQGTLFSVEWTLQYHIDRQVGTVGNPRTEEVIQERRGYVTTVEPDLASVGFDVSGGQPLALLYDNPDGTRKRARFSADVYAIYQGQIVARARTALWEGFWIPENF